MKPFVLSVPVCIAIYGCGAQSEAPTADTTSSVPMTVAAMPARQALTEPDFTARKSYGIATRRGNAAIGMTIDQALDIFTEPPGSFSRNELPPSIPPPYEARGWQKQNEGCGFILFNGHVAAIVYQLDGVKQDRLDEFLSLQRSAYGKEDKPMLSKHVNYWFWNGAEMRDKPSDSMMVCATELKSGTFNITIGAGTVPLMRALGMTEDAASRDSSKADELISEKKGPTMSNQAKG